MGARLAGGERPPPFYARQWAEKLTGDIDSIEAFLIDRSELAIELRQSSPFGGALSPEERWEIWRRVGEEFRAAHGDEWGA